MPQGWITVKVRFKIRPDRVDVGLGIISEYIEILLANDANLNAKASLVEQGSIAQAKVLKREIYYDE